MTRPARVVINLSALHHNLAQVRALAPHSKVMAIVKADAYGHGITRVASTLGAADAFGVACLEEARELRDAGITHPVVLLEGPYSSAEMSEISALNLDIVVHDESQVSILENTEIAVPVAVWLKIDSGMHRLGFLPDLAGPVWQRLQDCDSVADNIRLMTHLANASQRNDAMTMAQLECFQSVTGDFSAEKSIANSAGVIAYPTSHVDWIRPGLMLYGVSPMNDSTSREENLLPVMTLESKLIAIKPVRANEPVGYGATWRCPEDMLVGVVAAGYGDGYPRHAPSGTPVIVNGRKVALIGRASMDMLTVDLRTQPDASVGDPVVLWGEPRYS